MSISTQVKGRGWVETVHEVGTMMERQTMTQYHQMNELFSCISDGCKFIVVRK